VLDEISFSAAEQIDVIFQKKIFYLIIRPTLLSRLQKKHPNLNQRELRISLLVKLNYDTREIGRSVGISTRGMESIRYRMHKKLGLGKHQSIKTYLSDLAVTL